MNTKINLISPPASQTESSIALLWDKAECDEYIVFVDGAEAATVTATDYTAENLTQGEHTFRVDAVCNDEIIKGREISVSTKAKTTVVNVCDFGAKGDAKTDNTAAFKAAVESCPKNGTVYVPEGVYITGAIALKSDMTLLVDKGATILGSDNTADYPVMTYRFEGLEQPCYSSLISADNAENITIMGEGTINANGAALRKKELAEKGGKPGRAICLRSCKNIYMKDITVRQSPAWCVHIVYSRDISLNNVKIHTKYDENGNRYKDIVNGDGFDPDSCKNVYVFNSMIASQDDCIAIKSGRDKEGREVGISTENVRVTNCRFNSGFGVVVGSEMSGSVRDVFVQDCEFNNTFSIASIKPPRGRGGVVENIVYDNCTMKNTDTDIKACEWFRGAINLDMFYSHKEFDIEKAEEFNDGTSVINNVVIKNINIDTQEGTAIYMVGLPESHIKNVRLENVYAVGKYGIKAENIDDLEMVNVTVKTK